MTISWRLASTAMAVALVLVPLAELRAETYVNGTGRFRFTIPDKWRKFTPEKMADVNKVAGKDSVFYAAGFEPEFIPISWLNTRAKRLDPSSILKPGSPRMACLSSQSREKLPMSRPR